MPDRCCDGKRTPSFGVQSAYREGKCFSIDKSAKITLDGFYSWRLDFKKSLTCSPRLMVSRKDRVVPQLYGELSWIYGQTQLLRP